jgi:hypothetical protein
MALPVWGSCSQGFHILTLYPEGIEVAFGALAHFVIEKGGASSHHTDGQACPVKRSEVAGAVVRPLGRRRKSIVISKAKSFRLTLAANDVLFLFFALRAASYAFTCVHCRTQFGRTSPAGRAHG